MHMLPSDFTNYEPAITTREANRRLMQVLAAAICVGFAMGVAFSLCWARMSGAL
ncbi:hypothetical protein [Aureimonas sp. Leaf454]|uniref:hypothetical protein n=1 Tax=Aureimonas sp. Leaf454 TaxID=1736381 RepID=UPI000B31613F|nr:hypothetical protein [Aureimonas sp. Leaf454]